MPVFNPGGGAGGGPFICLVSCFLFVSVVAGGGCLLMYMILPETETKPWLPIVGVTLVCFPWFFWFLTFIYRLISRGSGLRFGINGNASGVAAAPNQTTAPADIHEAPAGEIGAAAMVELGSFKDGKRRAASLSRNSSSINVSHESEMPLAKSMAS